MPKFNTVITTDAGIELMTNSIAGKNQIEFVKLITGSGIYEEDEKTIEVVKRQTELKEKRQEFGFSSMEITGENSILLKTIITNETLDEGYRLTEIGIIAKKSGDDEEILYSVAIADEADYIPTKDNPVEIIQEYYTKISNSVKVVIDTKMGSYASAEDMQRVLYPEYQEPEEPEELEDGDSIFSIVGKIKRAISTLISHIANKDNPHAVTKEQIGLGKVDNTSDINKPISTAQQIALQEQYTQLTGYTDQAIADLIGGAPTTLDTLKEIADAIEENETVVEALDAAIGSKANKAEFDSHISNSMIHITATERETWDSATMQAETNKNAIAELVDNLSAQNETLAKISDYLKYQIICTYAVTSETYGPITVPANGSTILTLNNTDIEGYYRIGIQYQYWGGIADIIGYLDTPQRLMVNNVASKSLTVNKWYLVLVYYKRFV